MSFSEIINGYSVTHIKHTNTVCAGKYRSFNLNADGRKRGTVARILDLSEFFSFHLKLYEYSPVSSHIQIIFSPYFLYITGINFNSIPQTVYV
jgi:hypothetical protein